jgi:hypothetical protein
MRFTDIITAGLFGAILMFSIGTAEGSALAPGGTVVPSAFGGVFPGGSETLLASINGSYSNSQEFGSYRAAVYTNGGGTLDFVYDFNEDPTGQLSALESATMSMFAGYTTDVMFVVNSTTLVQPNNGFGAPSSVTRTFDGNVVKFFFPILGVGAGQASDTLIIRTNATTYTTGYYSIQDGQTSNLQGFEPSAAPEPGTIGMLGSALLGLAFFARRRRKA